MQVGQTSPILPSFMLERASFGDSARTAIQVLHARRVCICSSVAGSGVPRMVPSRHSNWLQSGSCRSLGFSPVRLPSRCTGCTTYLISGCSMVSVTEGGPALSRLRGSALCRDSQTVSAGTRCHAARGMSEPQWGALYSARRRGDVPAQLGLRAHVVYRVLARRHPAAPGAVRRRALKITKLGPAAAGGPQAEVSRPRYVSGRPAAPLCR